MSGSEDLLATRPPEVAEAEVRALLAQHYGLAGSLTQLMSERDLNLHLVTGAGGYVVKFANRAEPRAVTDFQTAALLHLEGNGLPVPRVVRTRSGACEVESAQGLMRVLTYLEGRPMHSAPASPARRRAMGEMAARISVGLQGLAHAGADHVLQWDIRQASTLRPL